MVCAFFKNLDGQKQLIRNCSSSLNMKMEKYLVCIAESRSNYGFLCFCNKDKCNNGNKLILDFLLISKIVILFLIFYLF